MTDQNLAHGTVVSDPYSTLGTATSPTNANDGNDATSANVAAGVTSGAGGRRGLKTDLASRYIVTSVRLKTADNRDTHDELWWSDDGTTWTGGRLGLAVAGSWGAGTTDRRWTFTTAPTARYWRYDRYDDTSGLHFYAQLNIFTWDITGTAPAPGAPVANFTASPNPATVGETVTFTDTSTGTPTSWAWTFGDAGTSTSQNPTHVYAAPGSYDVTLVATNAGGSDSVTKVSFIVVIPVAAAGLFFDWDGDGFGTGAYDLATADLRSYRFTRGSGAELTGGSQPGTLTLVMKNPSGRYNPENASGPLYGLLRDGVPVWLGVTNDGTFDGTGINGQFGGRITEITQVPQGGASNAPEVEILCEDAFGWYARTPIKITDARGRSQHTYRSLALTAAGETRVDLPPEHVTLPLSGADGFLANVLDALNSSSGTRHYIRPADNATDWYTYTARNRMYKLGSAADASVDAGDDHVTASDGFRKTAAGVINQQRASVNSLSFRDVREVVWQAENIPLTAPAIVGANSVVELWANFDDYTEDAQAQMNSSSGAVMTYYSLGRSMFMHIASAAVNTAIRVEDIRITGRRIERALGEGVVVDDLTSQAAPRGVRAGSELTDDLLGPLIAAKGLATHIVWRFGSPQLRPTVTVQNWLPYQLSLDLYDLIGYSSSQLAVTDRLFEIVGLTHFCDLAARDANDNPVVLHTTEYVLSESRQQTPRTWFTWDSSLWDGDDDWSYA